MSRCDTFIMGGNVCARACGVDVAVVDAQMCS